MATHRVTLIPGDGTGPELTEATRRVLEAAAATAGSSFDWDVQQAGVDVMETAGTPLPPETLESVKRNKVAIKGPITTPIGTGFRSVNVALRHELELFACVRPCKTYSGVRSRFDKVDVVIVRENTEDLYAGIEYEHGTDEADKVIALCNSLQKKQIRAGSGISIKPISEFGAERIIRYGFEYARTHGRKRVHAITKANIMKHTDGLFLAVAREVAKDYPDIELWENLVDATCMGLVQRPEEWDVLITPYRLGSTSTSHSAGRCTRPMHVASTRFSHGSMSGKSLATSRNVDRNSPSVNFMMLDLVMQCTRLRPLSFAYWKAYRMIRAEPNSLIGLMDSPECARICFFCSPLR